MRNLAWIALHFAIIATPVCAALARLPDARLFGVETPVDKVRWSLHDWVDEQTQARLTHTFEWSLGFRGALVRTDNTLFYDSLDESKPEAMVKVGRHGVLFISDDFMYASKREVDLPNVGVIDELARLTGRAQRRLEADGKHFIVVVAPSKTSIYPDDVPDQWSRPPHDRPRSDVVVYNEVRDAMNREHVRFADGRALLTQSANERDALFTTTGRHWSTVGACRVLHASAPDVFSTDCSYSWLTVDPVDPNFPDFDLFQLLDTWHPFLHRCLAPKLTTGSPRIVPLRALFVGTSFTFMLAEVARPFVRDGVFFYYNRTMYDMSKPMHPAIGPVDAHAPGWSAYALERDLYVLELFEGYLHAEYARDFLEQLLDHLP